MKKQILKGFTLIELLIVITIIGILALAFAQTVPGILARARDTARREGVNSIVQAVETYSNDNQKYPDGSLCLGKSGAMMGSALLDDYFSGKKAPVDPQVKAGFKFTACADGQYLYCQLKSPLNYFIAAKMELKGDGTYQAAQVNVAAGDCSATGVIADPIKPGADSDSAYVVVK